MKLVVDTNVVISGLFWQGAPHQLVELAKDGKVTFVTSPALVAEVAGVLSRDKFLHRLDRSGRSLAFVVAEMQASAEMVYPAPLPVPVCRDPDDDDVLACANAAHADMIVSGDLDLLAVGSYDSIPIVSPADALERIAAHLA